MSKLRINPNGNNRNQNRGSGLEQKRSNFNSEESNETLQYFLDRNATEFTKEDIRKFQQINKLHTDLFLENSNKLINKLFAISKILAERNNDAKENIPPIKFPLPDIFKELSPLISEVVEDGVEGNITFLNILMDELIGIEEELKMELFSIDNLYGRLSEMLNRLQSYNITQQKYIYRVIAKSINQINSRYVLVSPEDGSFVDLKFHKTISGSGQRISRGLSYILLDAETEEVLKFGNVKTI
jgi:hypothetical protein